MEAWPVCVIVCANASHIGISAKAYLREDSAPTCHELQSSDYCAIRDTCTQQHCAPECVGKVEAVHSCVIQEIFQETLGDHCHLCTSPETEPEEQTAGRTTCQDQEKALATCLAPQGMEPTDNVGLCIECDVVSRWQHWSVCLSSCFVHTNMTPVVLISNQANIDTLLQGGCLEISSTSPYCQARSSFVDTNCREECRGRVDALFSCRAAAWSQNAKIHCNYCYEEYEGKMTVPLLSSDASSKHTSRASHSAEQHVFRMPMLSVQDQKMFWAEKAGVSKETIDEWITDEDLEMVQAKVRNNLRTVCCSTNKRIKSPGILPAKLVALHADDDKARATLNSVQEQVESHFEDYLWNHTHTPGSSLGVQYDLWGILISNSPDPLIVDGRLAKAAVESLHDNCTVVGINDESVDLDICNWSIGTLLRRKPILDAIGILTDYEMLVVSESALAGCHLSFTPRLYVF